MKFQCFTQRTWRTCHIGCKNDSSNQARGWRYCRLPLKYGISSTNPFLVWATTYFLKHQPTVTILPPHARFPVFPDINEQYDMVQYSKWYLTYPKLRLVYKWRHGRDLQVNFNHLCVATHTDIMQQTSIFAFHLHWNTPTTARIRFRHMTNSFLQASFQVLSISIDNP